jgi:hypothetical protein
MKKTLKDFMALTVMVALTLCIGWFVLGCRSTTDRLAESASGKNVDLRGYLMLGELETAATETGTPVGKMIIGRAEYKSRKVGIPADQKVPTAGNFRAAKNKSFFGTEEIIIEYDFTAGSDADAKAALEALEKKKEAAQKAFAADK